MQCRCTCTLSPNLLHFAVRKSLFFNLQFLFSPPASLSHNPTNA